MSIDRGRVLSGAMAGFSAGAVLMVLFLVFDLVRGEPLATPNFLSSAVLGQVVAEAAPVRLVLYTIAHLAVFVVLGVVAVAIFDLVGVPMNLLVGAAYGLFGCSLVFYTALVASGARILEAPSWPAVFFGNLVAGVVMVEYLRRVGPEASPGVLRLLAARPFVREGLAVGLLGAAVVAAWFLIVDSVAREPLFTPAALGSALLYGAAGPEDVIISVGSVLGYTLFHVAAFLFVGLIIAALLVQAEKYPALLFGLLILFVVFETFFIALSAMLGAWLMEELAWWSVLAGNLLAALSMGAYLWKRHPKLRESLNDEALWAGR